MKMVTLKLDDCTFGVFSTFAGFYDEPLPDFIEHMAKTGFLNMFGDCVRGIHVDLDAVKTV
jgi:hypothetical protein